jgi:hypothetical protein
MQEFLSSANFKHLFIKKQSAAYYLLAETKDDVN